MDLSTLSSELDTIFLECPTDKSGCAKVQSLIDAFINKYGKDQPELRRIISERLDPDSCNCSVSRSHFKQMIFDWIISNNPDDLTSNLGEKYNNSLTSDKLEIFEYGVASCMHSTPLGIFNRRYRKIPPKKLSYSPNQGLPDSLESGMLAASHNEEFRSFRAASKTHNSSLENSLVKAEQKIIALEDELKQVKVNSRKEIERYREDIYRLQNYEKLHAEAVDKNEKYAETLNNLTVEYNKLKRAKENLDRDYCNLENEYHRMQSELDSRNVSLKTLETYKRVQSEELVVLQESKEILECEIAKLKVDLECRMDNEASLLNRIGELQYEKQHLQTELNEYMHFERLKMVSSSPFGKPPFIDDSVTEGIEDNRESGISMRSELMDSLGFKSLDDSLKQPYYSVIHSSDEVSFGYQPTQVNFVFERAERIEQEVQTEEITDERKDTKDLGIQTEDTVTNKVQTCHQKIQTDRVKKLHKWIETTLELRLQKVERGSQSERLTDTSFADKSTQAYIPDAKCSFADKSTQAYSPDAKYRSAVGVVDKSTSSECPTDQQVDSRCLYSRYSPAHIGLKPFHRSSYALNNTVDCLSPTEMDIDNSLEELRFSFDGVSSGQTLVELHDLSSTQNGSFREHSFPWANEIRDDSSSLDKSTSTVSYNMLPVLGKQNMSSPILRIRRLESRRFSCLDVYNRPITFNKQPTNYPKLTLSKKISTLLSGIISFVSPGMRLCEEGPFDFINDRQLFGRRSKSNIWICMKMLLILLTAGLLFLIFMGVLFLTRRKDAAAIHNLFRPYFVLKYKNGSPPI